jgi:hypothetical protein
MTADDPDPELEPKTNRTPAEVGRAIFRLLDQHEELRVTRGDSEFDVQIHVEEE